MFHKISQRLIMSALVVALLFSQLLSASAQSMTDEISGNAATVYLPLVSRERQSEGSSAEATPVEQEATTVTAATFSNHLFLPLVQRSAEGSADAEVNAATISVVAPDLCKSQAPDWILTMGPGVISVTSVSNGGAYYQPNTIGCNRWVIDIQVPSNSSGNGWTYPSFFLSLNAGLTSTPTVMLPQCASYRDHTSIYRKSQGQTEFTWIAGGWRTGVLSGSAGSGYFCQLQPEPTYQNFAQTHSIDPPASGTDIYRVATEAMYSGSRVTATVQAVHTSIFR